MRMAMCTSKPIIGKDAGGGADFPYVSKIQTRRDGIMFQIISDKMKTKAELEGITFLNYS